MPHEPPKIRRVCFVSGTRAEFGLMHPALKAIDAHRALQLQIVITGMHLDRSRGRSLQAVRAAGWQVDQVVPWARGDGSEAATAVATGKAIAAMAETFATLRSDIVLVTGDRVEAFAGAAAAHISGKLLAHVHGGDRALGLIDDSLRHAITKLAHIHFPATALSAQRIVNLGEDWWRVFPTGSPAADDLWAAAEAGKKFRAEFPGLQSGRFALLIIHPQTPDAKTEAATARMALKSVQSAGFEQVFIIYPNNDPGSDGIAGAWGELAPSDRLIIRRDVPRPYYLGLLREAAALVGNSSSGIIEAGSFGTPVLDIGDRQAGRERGPNVFHSPASQAQIVSALRAIWNKGEPIRFSRKNIYGTKGAGRRIASRLATFPMARFRQKLIAY